MNLQDIPGKGNSPQFEAARESSWELRGAGCSQGKLHASTPFPPDRLKLAWLPVTLHNPMDVLRGDLIPYSCCHPAPAGPCPALGGVGKAWAAPARREFLQRGMCHHQGASSETP